ncbi:predicted protein [Uncinocarpus reesii 1704]|uniref:Uncharacterized protein n=1 Tax=Uncinocarpus reesii (strain UAMH 1704) TaxID=336963 RepID=C4JK02_UNCRE|nr:uncharacterized protein UREG_01959 [Uncinocarpus reesii 1704]EEP77110.1 predicted protein [Uncinocarpus reesii 1704]
MSKSPDVDINITGQDESPSPSRERVVGPWKSINLWAEGKSTGAMAIEPSSLLPAATRILLSSGKSPAVKLTSQLPMFLDREVMGMLAIPSPQIWAYYRLHNPNCPSCNSVVEWLGGKLSPQSRSTRLGPKIFNLWRSGGSLVPHALNSYCHINNVYCTLDI